ncbi:MAG: PAS domain S-box protein [Anaerolineae bacterium]|nr:PAS domain S-box protein [Anaerolineae bacterium]
MGLIWEESDDPQEKTAKEQSLEVSSLMEELGKVRAKLAELEALLEQRVEERTKDLAEREARYRALVENLQDIVFLLGPRGELLSVFGNLMGIAGYTPGELESLPSEKRLASLFSSEDWPKIQAGLEKVSRFSSRLQLRVRLKDRAGEYRWVELLFFPLHSPQGDLVGIQGIARDISERVQEERLVHSLNASARVVQQASLSLSQVFDVITEELGSLGFFSMIALLDGERQELCVAKINGDERLLQLFRHILGRDIDRIGITQVGPFAEAVEKKQSVHFSLDQVSLEHLFRNVGSRARLALRLLPPLGVIVSPLFVEGQVLGILVVANEGLSPHFLPAIAAFANQTAIAIRNAQLVQELQEREKQYRGIFEAAQEGFVVCDLKGTIVEANPAACNMYGYPPQGLVNLSFEELFAPDRRQDVANFTSIVQQKGSFRVQSRGLRRNGETFPVEVSGTRLSYRGQEHLLAVVRDVTERVEAQRALIQAERLWALGQMAGGIAHDFNNILVSIQGYADMALLDLQENPAMVREDLQHILTGARDAAEAVRRLQSLYRQSEDTSDFVPVRLDDVVSEALALTRPHWKDDAQRRGVTIEVHTELHNPPAVMGNPSELHRVLTNLIVNAIEAMPSGGALTISTGQEGNWSYVEVRDTGTGMDEEQLARIFEPFFSTKKSSGLGLTVSLNIVKRHGGTIQVRSTPGEGSAFLVRLPCRRQKEKSLSEDSQNAQRVTKGLRVLVVDDENAVRALLVRLLEREGESVLTASSGYEALELLKKERFDLLITDLGMPGISGRELIAQAQRLHPGLPVILTTGWGETISPAQLRELNALALLSKPFTHQDLKEALSRLFPGKGESA